MLYYYYIIYIFIYIIMLCFFLITKNTGFIAYDFIEQLKFQGSR